MLTFYFDPHGSPEENEKFLRAQLAALIVEGLSPNVRAVQTILAVCPECFARKILLTTIAGLCLTENPSETHQPQTFEQWLVTIGHELGQVWKEMEANVAANTAALKAARQAAEEPNESTPPPAGPSHSIH